MSKFEDFAKLHVAGDPLVLFNAWDAGSAAAVAKPARRRSRPAAIGRRWPTASATARMCRSTCARQCGADREGGRAAGDGRFRGRLCGRRRGLAPMVERLAETGAIGCNFEDQVIGSDRLYDVGEQVERSPRCAPASATTSSSTLRTDLFLKAQTDAHDRRWPTRRSSAAGPLLSRRQRLLRSGLADLS